MWRFLVACLLLTPAVASAQYCFPGPCSNSDKRLNKVSFEFDGTDTTLAAALAAGYNIYGSPGTVTQYDNEDEWDLSVSVTDSTELCANPKNSRTATYLLTMTQSFEQSAGGEVLLSWGYSDDGEGVVAGDEVGPQTTVDLAANTLTQFTWTQRVQVVPGGCVAPLIDPDDTVDLIATDGHLTILELGP